MAGAAGLVRASWNVRGCHQAFLVASDGMEVGTVAEPGLKRAGLMAEPILVVRPPGFEVPNRG
jgi:hypothetical protein